LPILSQLPFEIITTGRFGSQVFTHTEGYPLMVRAWAENGGKRYRLPTAIGDFAVDYESKTNEVTVFAQSDLGAPAPAVVTIRGFIYLFDKRLHP
jgi:hypothetical protein